VPQKKNGPPKPPAKPTIASLLVELHFNSTAQITLRVSD
jgi:hypothetical protein